MHHQMSNINKYMYQVRSYKSLKDINIILLLKHHKKWLSIRSEEMIAFGQKKWNRSLWLFIPSAFCPIRESACILKARRAFNYQS